jgi:insertion element IS1 protein InsB
MRWSFAAQGQQRWLWHASGAVLAYVIGSHEDTSFLQLKALLAPFRITRFYTDDWEHINDMSEAQHEIGKRIHKN